jgi:hypothetical protein
MARPDYLALDNHGLEYKRSAAVIGELPHQEVAKACKEAAGAISKLLGTQAPESLKFGLPVFASFKMTRQQAKHHAQAALLLSPAHAVSLAYCPSYN